MSMADYDNDIDFEIDYDNDNDVNDNTPAVSHVLDKSVAIIWLL